MYTNPVLKLMTDFVFIEDAPQKADVIFVPGNTWPEPSERAAMLWREGYAEYIIPSGKYSILDKRFMGASSKAGLYDGDFETEGEFLASVMIKCGVDPAAILLEPEARTTLDNAIFTRKVTDAKGLTVKKAIICCQAFHARRCKLLYSLAYPGCEMIMCPAETQGVNKLNWLDTPNGIDRVTMEFGAFGFQMKDAIPNFLKNGRLLDD